MADDAAAPEPQVVEPLAEEDYAPREKAFELIFDASDSQKLREASRQERTVKCTDEGWDEQKFRDFSYSEMSMKEMHRLLNQIKGSPMNFGPLYQEQGTFLDLGSGAGKACIAAALLHPFKKVVGIELLKCLGDASNDAKGIYGDAEKLAALETPLPEGLVKPELEFLTGDFEAEFDEKIASLAPDLSICFANATFFGEKQMKAMVKLANLMPEGSLFITITQKLPEYLIINLDRDPKQRHAVALKRELKNPGMDPRGREIIPAPAKNDMLGWREVLGQEIELEWGMTSIHVFRKLCFPYCEVGDLCFAAPRPPKKEKKEAAAGDGGDEIKEEEEKIDENAIVYSLTVYRKPREVTNEEGVKRWCPLGCYLDDPFEEEVEMFRMEPLTVKRLEVFHEKYAKDVAAAKAELNKSPDPAMAALPGEGVTEIKYTAIEAPTPETKLVPTDEIKEYGSALLKTCQYFAELPWAPRFVERDFAEVCREQDTENTGKITSEQLFAAWKGMRERLVGVTEDKLKRVADHELLAHLLEF